MIKAIFFDMDGTLINSEAHYLSGTYELMKKHGYTGDINAVSSIIGTTMDKTYEIILDLLNHKLTYEELKEINETYFKENKLDINKNVFEGVLEVFRALKEKGLKIAICSSSSKKEIDRFVDEIKLNDYVDLVVTGDDMKNGKPAPDIYLYALNYFDINSNEAIVLEDSYSGIKAGKTANILTLARKDIQFGLNQSEADGTVDDMYSFLKYVESKLEVGR